MPVKGKSPTIESVDRKGWMDWMEKGGGELKQMMKKKKRNQRKKNPKTDPGRIEGLRLDEKIGEGEDQDGDER